MRSFPHLFENYVKVLKSMCCIVVDMFVDNFFLFFLLKSGELWGIYVYLHTF